jgi:phosphoribosylformylglycinamidine synthase
VQRRAEVIGACWALGANPIAPIHDIGAGGCRTPYQVVDHGHCGALIDLRAIPSDARHGPMELWCSESQERYMLAIEARDVERFAAICARERCPLPCSASSRRARLVMRDPALGGARSMPMEVLFGKPPDDAPRGAARPRHRGSASVASGRGRSSARIPGRRR